MQQHELANLDDLRSLARGAVAQQDYHTAGAILETIVQRDPSNAEDWHKLAHACINTDALNDAARCLKRAISLRPKAGDWTREYAGVLSALGNYPQAMTQHRRALSQGVTRPSLSWIEIARIQERMRQPKLARKSGEEALKLEPNLWAAHHLLGDLAAAERDFDAALGHYDNALRLTPDPLQKANVGHAIAVVHERRKEWEEAFESHRRANHVKSTSEIAKRLMREEMPTRYEAYASEEAATLYQSWARRTFDDGFPDPIFLVGFPRSGTTMTEQVLAALPNVRTTDEHTFMSPVNTRANAMIAQLTDPPESHVARLDRLTPGQLTELRTIYWNGVWKVVGTEAREKGLRVVDKHPLRILDLGLANLLFPGSKAIVLLRDPRDCCLSCFFQDLGLTPLSARFLRLETLGEAYALVMGLWLRMRDKLTIDTLEVRYEDLVADFEPNARRLVEFIGEAWTDDVLRFHEKAAKRAINTPSYQAVTEKVNTRAVGKWANYERHLGPLLAQIRPFLEAFGYEE